MSTFSLEFWTEKNDFCMYAETGDDEKELKLEGKTKDIVSRFNRIYDVLEEKKVKKLAEFEDDLNVLSEIILTPFAAELKKCDLVRFVVYDDLIRCAFDLLPFEGTYLFLQRRICYQVDEGQGEDAPTIEMGSALLIADLTADPEEACLQVFKIIPDSDYAKMEDTSVAAINKAADQVDVLVVSAHGDLEADNSGEIYINGETIRTATIKKLEAWVVYFDSCSQGANMDYVQAFQDDSDVQYYLAPIVSNDAGDSSTRTMVWFFTGLREHLDPIRGLFETRKRLYEYYRKREKLDLITTLNKAFVFRLYEFVDGEEE